MGRKKRVPHIYKPSTHNIFFCLSSAKKWCQLLLTRSEGKTYEPFLKFLVEKDFFESERSDRFERFTIKSLAQHSNYKPADVTKWISNIYDDIFELNMENENLFQTDGVKHNLYFQYLYDNTASWIIWLKQTPRQYEKVCFDFVKAKVGTYRFWAKDITHNITEEDHHVDIWLSGSTLNRHRELLYDRALFEGRLGFFESHDLEEFEIDDRLIKEYR